MDYRNPRKSAVKKSLRVSIVHVSDEFSFNWANVTFHTTPTPTAAAPVI